MVPPNRITRTFGTTDLLFLFFFQFPMILWLVSGHGYLAEPPSRSSMWLFGYNTPPNYNHMGLNCGGFARQWVVNQGRCGTCGDPWDDYPRENESGGGRVSAPGSTAGTGEGVKTGKEQGKEVRYATGIITRTYSTNQKIQVTVILTAFHRGWFQFSLCPSDAPGAPANQSCLDRYPLPIVGPTAGPAGPGGAATGSDQDGQGVSRPGQATRYHLSSSSSGDNNPMRVTVTLALPPGLTCSRCLLQWKWNVANNWGTNADGKSCLGCGPQEQFYGCADIAIQPDLVAKKSNGNPLNLAEAKSLESVPPAYQSAPVGSTGADRTRLKQLRSEGENNNATITTTTITALLGLSTSTSASTSPSTLIPASMSSSPSASVYPSTSLSASLSASLSPSPTATDLSLFSISKSVSSSSIPFTSASTSTAANQDGTRTVCRATRTFQAESSALDSWCSVNCASGYCPSTHCKCSFMVTKATDADLLGEVVSGKCVGAGVWAGIKNMEAWCTANCAVAFCPATYCVCI